MGACGRHRGRYGRDLSMLPFRGRYGRDFSMLPFNDRGYGGEQNLRYEQHWPYAAAEDVLLGWDTGLSEQRTSLFF